VKPPAPAPDAAAAIDAASTEYTDELPTSIDLDKGFEMSIGFGEHAEYADTADLEGSLAKLALRLTGPDGKTRWQRQGFKAVAGISEIPKFLLELCDTYVAELTPAKWGDGAGVRISVACRRGEDMFSATEHATLLELTNLEEDPYPPLWQGEADQTESENGVCTSERKLSFALAGPTLTITTAEAGPGRGTSCGRPKKTTAKVTVQRRPR
jgi:hypothetical protein